MDAQINSKMAFLNNTKAPVHGAFDVIDIGAFSDDSRYKFLMGSVVPRPIALVTSLSSDGVLNAAPFSQFTVISVTPPMLGFVVHETSSGEKDTVRNILASGEYVINTVAASMAEQVQACSLRHPADVSEIDEVGFRTLPSEQVAPARIAESAMHFECRLHKAVPLGTDGSQITLIIGEIIVAHAADGVVSGHRVDHAKLDPLGRISGRTYCLTQDVIHV